MTRSGVIALAGVALAAERGWGEEAYEINSAFYQALQIE